MDFELSGEQQMLRDNVARLMKDRYGFEARKGYQASPQGWSEALWREYRRDGAARRAVCRRRRRLRRRRGRNHDRDGGVRQGAGARTLSPDRRPLRRAAQARREPRTTDRAHRQDRRGRAQAELRPGGTAVGLRSERRRAQRPQGRRRLRAERRKGTRRPGRQRRCADRFGAPQRRAPRSRRDRPLSGRRQCARRHAARLSDPGRAARGGDRFRQCAGRAERRARRSGRRRCR